MSDKLHIEHAATRAPQEAGNRYVRQASHRARGHQSTTSGGQQICHTRLTKSTRPPEHHKVAGQQICQTSLTHRARGHSEHHKWRGNRYVIQD
ncbi:hypothetical protein RRG08_059864 [Elysia crispata]|uniref:Uncharacterized protein n=1 Tax=Elysia crispata TaxID=231223 RepID=A0AAE1D1G3_9GAST|nr:hypothetical protein RRG08_059864 [Elysia crispata]